MEEGEVAFGEVVYSFFRYRFKKFIYDPLKRR